MRFFHWILQSHRHPYTAWFVLFFSLFLTAVAWYISQTAIQEKFETRFELQSQEIVSAINKRLKAYEMAIRSGKSFFDASEKVTREEWQTYVTGMQIERNFPGIQGIGYSEFVQPQDLQAHIDKIKQEGFADYTVRPAGKRDLYSAIVFLEPFDWRNRRAFGYDMFSQKTRREAMERARDSGEPAISGRVTLVQETNTDVQFGFLMYVPVYRHGLSTLTLEERHHAIQGYVYSPFRAADFMHGILGLGQKGLLLELFDGDQAKDNHVLFRSEYFAHYQQTNYQKTIVMPNSQRTWTVRVTATPEFFALENQSEPMLVGIGGFIIDILLFLIINSMNQKERRLTKQAKALEKAKQEAEQANIAKSTFLAAMSHEVRTPMNGVVGMLEILNQSSLTSDQVEMVKTIQESSENLLNIINDILDFSKIEAGKMELHSEKFEIEAVVDKTCLLLDRLALKQGVEMSLFFDPDIPPFLTGDCLRLTQVLTNLLNNAIKFSARRSDQKGKVRLEVLLEQQVGQRVWLNFKVIDNGIGIDAEQLGRLFQAFEQADRSTTRQYGGTGLGLTISKQLAQMMGGDIRVKSQLGQGSEFIVNLPFEVALSPEPSEIIRTLSALQGASCLLIGEDHGRLPDIKRYLTHLEINSLQVASLEDAFKSPELPELWLMEVFDEPPLLAELEAKLRPYPQIKLIILSHLASHQNRRRNVRKMSEHIVQSDDNVFTRQRLYHLLGLASGLIHKVDNDSQMAQHSMKQQGMSRTEAIAKNQLILVAEDNEINQKVIRRQLTLLGRVADYVENGEQALQQWQKGEYGLVLTDLHMPVMDGMLLTQKIREQEKQNQLPMTPVIAFTANAIKGEARKCLANGMNDYLIKPALISEIEAMLHKWLPQSTTETTESIVMTEAAVSLNLETFERLDLNAIRQLVGEDPELISSILQDFQVSAKQTLQEIRSYVQKQNLAQIGALAHRLKSSSATVGAMKLHQICLQLQTSSEENDWNKTAQWVMSMEQEMTALFDDILNVI